MRRSFFLLFILILFLNACASRERREETEVVKKQSTEDSLIENKKSDETKSKTKMIIPSKAKESEGLEKRAEITSSEEKPKKTWEERKEEIKNTTSGLKAGFADDNKQFNYFIRFLEKYKDKVTNKIDIPVQERIIFQILDKNKKPVFLANLTIFDSQNRKLESGVTMANGTYLFFPAEHKEKSRYIVEIQYGNTKEKINLEREGNRKIEVMLKTERPKITTPALDIVFIFDTTGSMGEEIERLKQTIELINLNLTNLTPKPKVRFGLTLYKDREEEYVTKIIPLTDNLDLFQEELNKVVADGGGDYPEDLESALRDTVYKMNWDPQAIKLAFIITDAATHIYEDQTIHYDQSVRTAKSKGIKIFSIGTGGLDIQGEYVLRQIAQYTSGKYIFLTYGNETGENEGGKEGSVSHHTGANYQTNKLETIIIQFAKEELNFVSDKPIEIAEEFFQAKPISDEKREETLKKISQMAIQQLIDFSSIRIPQGTPAALIYFTTTENALKSNAEYFSEQFMMALSQNKIFQMVERKDLQKILSEMQLQSSDLFEEKSAVKVGNLLGAKLLFVGKMYQTKENYEIFVKLLRVETGETLSMTKMKIDKKLGL